MKTKAINSGDPISNILIPSPSLLYYRVHSHRSKSQILSAPHYKPQGCRREIPQ
ncbi:hypothetical protein RHMOL_Rhmol07G0162000 [Rhododendron molle]|uniref:Uncharacterized protein n=1 Tax=Rhododendron molle TaxID=49168 RepID=A0ACC0N107_RHOML|nr:hypothetical protein RHMOL_Rhmol07G0162000 [Rhododendron molle]